jgi:transcriptional regulator with XRE-family HTH domain
MAADSAALDANRLIGYNLSRIRRALGLSQEEAAARLEPYLGTRWSKTVYSAAERSYDSKRVRQFTGNDVLAMSLAFGVTIGYFFLPPRPQDRDSGAVLRSGDSEVPWQQVILAGNGYTWPAAVALRVRELPEDEQPPRRLADLDPLDQRYGIPPGAQLAGNGALR